MAKMTRREVTAVVREYRENRGEDTMTAGAYMLTLTVLIAGGLLLATYIASLTYDLAPQPWWIAAYFGVAILGCLLGASGNAFFGLIGYALIVLPTGWIVGPYVKLFQVDSVLTAVYITAAVTITLGIIGAFWNKVDEQWGAALLFALTLLIVFDLGIIALILAGFKENVQSLVTTSDWIGIVIFSGFVFYDMNQAVHMPRNFSNALFAAINMYLNILNLFIRFLARSGKLAVEVAPDAAAAVVSGAIDA